MLLPLLMQLNMFAPPVPPIPPNPPSGGGIGGSMAMSEHEKWQEHKKKELKKQQIEEDELILVLISIIKWN